MVWNDSLTTQIVGITTALGVVSKCAVYFHSVYAHKQTESMDDDEIDDAIKDDPEFSKNRFQYLRSIVQQEVRSRGESNLRHIDDNATLVRVIFDLLTELGHGRNQQELRRQVRAVINKYNFPSKDFVLGLLSTYFEADENDGILRESDIDQLDHDTKGDVT
jgi:hypothetical protein